MRYALCVLAAGVSIMQAPVRAQEAPDLDVLLDRLGTYIATYESELSTVIAEEHYEQLVPDRIETIGTPTVPTSTTVRRMRKRVLEFVVPKEMFEEFYSTHGRGEGRARYSNYRRFTTAGRVVPQ